MHVDLVINNHHNLVTFNVIKTPSNLVILGLSWLKMLNLHIDWKPQIPS